MILTLPYRGIEEVHGVAVEEEQRDDDGGGHDGAPEHVLRRRSLQIRNLNIYQLRYMRN